MKASTRVLCILAVVLSMTFAFTLIALAYNNGTFVGEGNGLFGPIKVEVKVAGGKIEAIKVLEHSETPGISDAAFNNVIPAIIEKQSVDVDTVSGATMTSNGIIAAVKDALDLK